MKYIHNLGLLPILILITPTRRLAVNLFEYTPWVEHAWVNLIRVNISLADQEYLGNSSTLSTGAFSVGVTITSIIPSEYVAEEKLDTIVISFEGGNGARLVRGALDKATVQNCPWKRLFAEDKYL